MRISFLSDERVRVQVRKQVETRNYAEMGFEDMRSGKPNQGWHLLRKLVVNEGVLTDSSRRGKEFIAMEKGVERLRRGLRQHFGISSDPLPWHSGKGYICRFKTECAPSFGPDSDPLRLF